MNESTLTPIAHFDSGTLEASLRAEAWHENMGMLFDLSADDQPCELFCEIDAAFLGDTVIGTTHANGQLFERSHRRIAIDRLDHVLLQVFMEGGGTIPGNGEIVAGDMLIIDLAQPHEMRNTDFRNLTLVLPRDVHPDLTAILAPLHDRKLAQTNPVIRLMTQHLVSLWNALPDMNADQATGVVHDSLDLLVGGLGREQFSIDASPGTATELNEIVRRHIDANLAETLSPASIAAACHISRSQLYRLFEADEGVARYVWQRRLARAMRLLIMPRNRNQTILTIACECGFTSEAHFSRAFRARFGIAPGQARREAQEQMEIVPLASRTVQSYPTVLPDLINRL